MPPRTSPTAAPPTAIAAHTPIAFVRSAPSSNVVVMIDSAAGAISAAPSPWTPRKTISASEVGASPFSERGDREDDDADEEDPLAPHQVAGAPAEKQEAAEGERVRVDDPLQVGVRHLQVFLDRGQRDVHDRRVEDDHELRHADEAEHEPRVHVVVVRGARVAASSLMRRAP